MTRTQVLAEHPEDRQIMDEDGFAGEYQRLWASVDKDKAFRVVLIQYATEAGAAISEEQALPTYQRARIAAGDTWSTFDASAIPGAEGYIDSYASKNEVDYGVRFHSGIYNVDVFVAVPKSPQTTDTSPQTVIPFVIALASEQRGLLETNVP